MQPRTPIYIVTSSRPRVGKTLIARVLVEYFCIQQRAVRAFDINPDDSALTGFLPDQTAAASIQDTRGEIALFDQLVVADEMPKVIDLAHSQFERFFALMKQINFGPEARKRGIVPIVLFVADPGERSRHGYATLCNLFADLVLVPVLNQAVPQIAEVQANFPATHLGGPPIALPALTAVVRSVVDRPQFSFTAYAFKSTDATAELHRWMGSLFRNFRQIEERLTAQPPQLGVLRSA
jgi:hypothetical protein